MLEKSFAAVVAAVCLALLVRLCLPERYRWRLDAAARSCWQTCRAWALHLWRWRSTRNQAALIAEEAIRRARTGVERDGNVLRPKAFKQTRGEKDARDSGEPRKPH